MKVSLKWIEHLAGVNNDLPLGESDLIERIGAQLGEVDNVSRLKDKYDQATVAEVIISEPISGSDHLSSCLVDDNGVNNDVERDADGYISVVCGAPNVSAGQKVVWLPPGSIVPASSDNEPFRLTVRKMMGVKSNGMIASLRELALGDDHQGILVLPEDSETGSSLVDLLELDDTVIDIENKMFTHRPDLFGQLGIARELCGIYGRKFTSPDWFIEDAMIAGADDKVKITVNNELANSGCSRFMAVAVANIDNTPSPLWLQSLLMRCGIRPISLIVDVTNYVMMSTGQPLHAYELNKISNGDEVNFNVRLAKDGEKLTLLDESTLSLSQSDIVIANDEQALGLAGVMGGSSSAITPQTNSLVLECATFDMYAIRRTSMSHGIFSDAVTRYTKGQSPRQCRAVLAFALNLIKEFCPTAEVISNVADFKDNSKNENNAIELSYDLLNEYLGFELDKTEAINLLNNVELEATEEAKTISVKPPFWRTDLSEPEDLIEEVARLFGFNRLPLTLPSSSFAPAIVPPMFKLKAAVRHFLASGGANELLTYSFINERLLTNVGQDPKLSFKIANSLSPDLKYYRQSLTPSLLSKVHQNHKAGYGSFALFEIGKGHLVSLTDEQGAPEEIEALAFVVSNEKSTQANLAPYFHARAYLDYLFSSLSISLNRISISSISANGVWLNSAALPFSANRSGTIYIDDQAVGVIGEYRETTMRALKLPDNCAGFELNLKPVSEIEKTNKSQYRPLSRFPKVNQDLTLNTSLDQPYSETYNALKAKLKSVVPEDMSISVKPIDSYVRPDGGVNWTFRLSAESYTRTLTDKEVVALVDSLHKSSSEH